MTRADVKFILNPLYWPAWCLIALSWFLAFLPYRFLMFKGRCLGLLMYCFPTYSKKVATINIKLCFPELTDKARKKLLRDNFKSIGMAFFELIFSWWASDKRVRALVTFKNSAALEKAFLKGQGALGVVPHMLTLEIVGRLTALHFDSEAVYRPHRKPFIDKLNRWHLSKVFKNAIPRHDVRGIVRALKANRLVFFLPDIDAGKHRSFFSPFFNIPAATVDSAGRIAGMAKTDVVPVGIYRCDDFSGYEVVFHDSLDAYPSDDVQTDVDRMNRVFEEIIRKKPEQYLWSYRRFYTRPDGESPLYPSKRH
jgi:KDO2-lipid IV(A) lauroyltransferase